MSIKESQAQHPDKDQASNAAFQHKQTCTQNQGRASPHTNNNNINITSTNISHQTPETAAMTDMSRTSSTASNTSNTSTATVCPYTSSYTSYYTSHPPSTPTSPASAHLTELQNYLSFCASTYQYAGAIEIEDEDLMFEGHSLAEEQRSFTESVKSERRGREEKRNGSKRYNK